MLEQNENNQITIDGNLIGTIKGFIFEKNSDDELTTEITNFITKRLEEKVDKLIEKEDAALEISEDFFLKYDNEIIANFKKTDNIFSPDFDPIIDPMIDGLPLARLALHLQSYIKRKINVISDPLEVLRKTEGLSDHGNSLMQKIIIGLGYVPRNDVLDLLKDISSEDKVVLRKSGVRFAQYSIFVKDTLKPAAQEIKLFLWALFMGHEKMHKAPPAGVVSVPYEKSLPKSYYDIIGYKICDSLAVRVDMIEKLADALRPLGTKNDENPKGEFEVNASHMSYVGRSGEDMDNILKSLGYKYRTETIVNEDKKEEPDLKEESEKDQDSKQDSKEDSVPKERKIWFWSPLKKHNKNKGGKPVKTKKKFDKKSSKGDKSPYVNMPSKHKIKDDSNPFSVLSNLK